MTPNAARKAAPGGSLKRRNENNTPANGAIA
jgi:hypothetical protein